MDIIFPSQPLSSQIPLKTVPKTGIPLFSSTYTSKNSSSDNFMTDATVVNKDVNSNYKRVDELPKDYQHIFCKFTHFNKVQTKLFNDVMYSNNPIVLSAPTGSGKTVVFELAIVRALIQNQFCFKNLKVVYMAPLKALCNERFLDWQEKFKKYSLKCMEVTGDSEVDDYDVIRKANFIFTTPEKWDSVTRKWKEHSNHMQHISLFLIDEIHMVGDADRGSTIEAVISRMKCVKELTKSELRFIAVSATIPNAEDIAQWISSENCNTVCFNLDESYRPVPLQKVVLSYGNCSPATAFKFDLNLNFKLDTVIQQYSCNKPTIVFCSTRKSTMQAATQLKQRKRYVLDKCSRSELRNRASNAVDVKLRELLPFGVGYHHAGLTQQDRHLVESLFLSGLLPVLCATSTLAMGVNLPAHLVVVKSTMHYAGGVFREYSPADVLQMIGRAGRPQFDTSAVAVILTQDRTRDIYNQLISGRQLIESNFHLHLTDHLNSEIVLKTLTHVNTAKKWITSSYLYVRIVKNPSFYGLTKNASYTEVISFLQESIMNGIKDLREHNLIVCAPDGSIETTGAGTLMARFCVAYKTMKLFCEVKGDESLPELIELISHAHEFNDVQLRVNEKAILNSLNKSKTGAVIRFPYKDKIKTKEKKISVLLQSSLSCLSINDFSLNQESIRLMKIASRLSRCFFEYHSSFPSFLSYVNGLLIMKCFSCKLWENTKFVAKQFKTVGVALSGILANAGFISIPKLVSAEPRELEMITNKNPPFGTLLIEQASSMPMYDLFVQQVAQINSHQASLEITIKAKNKCEPTNNTSTSLVVGTPENVLLYKTRLKDKTIFDEKNFTCCVNVYRTVEDQAVIFWVISHAYVGCDIKSKYSPSFLPHPSFKNRAKNDAVQEVTRKSLNYLYPQRAEEEHKNKINQKLNSSSLILTNSTVKKQQSGHLNKTPIKELTTVQICRSKAEGIAGQETNMPRSTVFSTPVTRKRQHTEEASTEDSKRVKNGTSYDEYDVILEEMNDSGYFDEGMDSHFEFGVDDLLDSSQLSDGSKNTFDDTCSSQNISRIENLLTSQRSDDLSSAAGRSEISGERISHGPQLLCNNTSDNVKIIGINESGEQVRECGHKCSDKTSCSHFCCRFGVKVKQPKAKAQLPEVTNPNGSLSEKRKIYKSSNTDMCRLTSSISFSASMNNNNTMYAMPSTSAQPNGKEKFVTSSKVIPTNFTRKSTERSSHVHHDENKPTNCVTGIREKYNKIMTKFDPEIMDPKQIPIPKSSVKIAPRENTNVNFYVNSCTQSTHIKSIFDDIFD